MEPLLALEERLQSETSSSNIVPLARDVIDRATEIRAQFNFKTPDSIQLAAATVATCDVFLTNDHRFNRFTDHLIDIAIDVI